MFSSTVNKYTKTIITIMIIMIINVKIFCKDIFAGSYFCEKRGLLFTTTLTYSKARKVLCDLFSTNQENDSEITFLAVATKIK